MASHIHIAHVPEKLYESATRLCASAFFAARICLLEHEALICLFWRQIILAKRKLHLMTKRYREAETTIADLKTDASKLRHGETKNKAELGGWRCMQSDWMCQFVHADWLIKFVHEICLVDWIRPIRLHH